jgi:hypothetical protein
LDNIRSNNESYDESSQPIPAPIARYAAYSIRSNPYYAASTTIATEAEHRERMQELLDDIGSKFHLNGASMGSYNNPVVLYDAQLDLDDDYEQDYDARAHG